MKKAVLCLWLVLAMGWISPAAAKAEAPYCYRNIPFEATSASEIEPILAKEFGQITKNEYGTYLIEDFGYTLHLDIAFRGRKGVERVNLYRSVSGYRQTEAFRALVQQDMDQFMDMENQLIQRYGAPDFRFFYTREANTNIWTRFMFPDAFWNAERLMDVFDSNQYLMAYSVWNNVTLRVWANGLDKRSRGYLSKLDLQFHYQSEWKETPAITEYKRK